jgi:hypothetical protein
MLDRYYCARGLEVADDGYEGRLYPVPMLILGFYPFAPAGRVSVRNDWTVGDGWLIYAAWGGSWVLVPGICSFFGQELELFAVFEV